MEPVVNLYKVSAFDYEYCYFVFASSRNKAKALCVNHFGDEPYTEFRSRLLKKNVGGENDVVVDCPEDRDYNRVTDLGFEYCIEEDY